MLEYVGRFKISMHYFIFVKLLKSIHNLLKEEYCMSLRYLTKLTFIYISGQITVLTIVHNNPITTTTFLIVVTMYNITMANTLHNFYFCLKTLNSQFFKVFAKFFLFFEKFFIYFLYRI